MRDTPRTDAQGYGDGRHPYVSTEFARELERELAAEREDHAATADMLTTVRCELAAERELADRLANEVDCLANWREAYGANCHYDPRPLAAYKAARDETRH